MTFHGNHYVFHGQETSNDSELMPYTALANSYWVSIHDVYQYQGHAH